MLADKQSASSDLSTLSTCKYRTSRVEIDCFLSVRLASHLSNYCRLQPLHAAGSEQVCLYNASVVTRDVISTTNYKNNYKLTLFRVSVPKTRKSLVIYIRRSATPKHTLLSEVILRRTLYVYSHSAYPAP